MDIESDRESNSSYDEAPLSNQVSDESEKELLKLEEIKKEKENFIKDLKMQDIDEVRIQQFLFSV